MKSDPVFHNLISSERRRSGFANSAQATLQRARSFAYRRCSVTTGGVLRELDRVGRVVRSLQPTQMLPGPAAHAEFDKQFPTETGNTPPSAFSTESHGIANREHAFAPNAAAAQAPQVLCGPCADTSFAAKACSRFAIPCDSVENADGGVL